jgi:hypothetical protein
VGFSSVAVAVAWVEIWILGFIFRAQGFGRWDWVRSGSEV